MTMRNHPITLTKEPPVKVQGLEYVMKHRSFGYFSLLKPTIHFQIISFTSKGVALCCAHGTP